MLHGQFGGLVTHHQNLKLTERLPLVPDLVNYAIKGLYISSHLFGLSEYLLLAKTHIDLTDLTHVEQFIDCIWVRGIIGISCMPDVQVDLLCIEYQVDVARLECVA